MPIDLNIISAGNDRFRWLQTVRTIQDQLPNSFVVHNVPDMIQEMLNRCGNQTNSIRFVRIFGHGSPACQFIGSGDLMPENEAQKLGLDETTKTLYNQGSLARLRGYFASVGGVVLHGCLVGSGTIGREFLEKLSMLWQVSTAASEENQTSQLSGDLALSPLHGRIRQVLVNLPQHSPTRGRNSSISYSSVSAAPETTIPLNN